MRAIGYRMALSAGLALAATAAPAAAQGVHGPPPVPATDFAAVGPAPTVLMPTPPASPPPPACTCGDRHGLSRWRWHRTQCRRKHQEKWIGYPEEFNEWPLGRAVYAHANTQVANGAAARMVFYEYDFVDGTAELNLRGRDKLAAIAAQLPTSFFPVVVERTPRTPGLDQTRRLTVLGQLAGGPFPVPAERVVVGPPIARGYRGAEAFLVERNRLGSVASEGGLGGGVGGVGSTVGAGSLDPSGLTGSAIAPGVR